MNKLKNILLTVSYIILILLLIFTFVFIDNIYGVMTDGILVTPQNRTIVLDKNKKEKTIRYNIYNLSFKKIKMPEVSTSCSCSVVSSNNTFLKPFSKSNFHIKINTEKASEKLYISIYTSKNREIVCKSNILKE